MRGKQGCVCLSLQSYQDKFRVKRWVHNTMDSLGRRLKAPSALEGWFRDTWSLGNRLQCSITLEELREYHVCWWDLGMGSGGICLGGIRGYQMGTEQSDPPEVSPAGIWWLWETTSPWGRVKWILNLLGGIKLSLVLWGSCPGYQGLVSLKFPGHGFKGHQVVSGIFGEFRRYQASWRS